MLHSKIGLVLSAGGAKGLAHIGVIKELEKLKMKFHCITGTSSGALVGGLYSYTGSIKAVEVLANSISKRKWAEMLIPNLRLYGTGIMTGDSVGQFLQLVLPKNAKIEDCKIPFRCVAADIKTGKQIVFVKGNLIKAIRASISLPVTFQPVKLKNYLLVDGGCLNPAPVDQAIEMGATKILLVSTTQPTHNLLIGKATKLNILQTYMRNSTSELIRHAADNADITLYPKVQYIDQLSFWKAREAIKLGEAVVIKNKKKLRELQC